MRLYVVLIVVTIILAFLTGILSLSLVRAPRSTEEAALGVSQFKRDFQERQVPLAILDLERALPVVDPVTLIDPREGLPHLDRYPATEVRRLDRYARGCEARQIPRRIPAVLEKAWVWHRFLCKNISRLPKDFHFLPPYLHPSGVSYAFLEFSRSGRLNVAYAHLLELPALKRKGVVLPESLQFLSELDLSSLTSFAQGDPLILAPGKVFIRRIQAQESGGLGSYAVYRREPWDGALERTPFQVSYRPPASSCLVREGGLCWQYSFGRTYRSFNRIAGFFILGALSLLATLVWILVQRIRQQRRDEEEKQFALQTLTHELRTPLTSLALSMDTLRNRFDSMSEDEQAAFLRSCDAVSRFRRLIEGSRRYLASRDGRGGAIVRQGVESLNTYLQHVLEPFEDGVEIELPEEDRAFTLDGYWFGICIGNLVENAMLHGRPPVVVRAEVTRDGMLTVSVADGGTCDFTELGEMTRTFVKGKNSRGTGLGLAIVEKVMRQMEGTFQFESDPTTFTLKIRDGGQA